MEKEPVLTISLKINTTLAEIDQLLESGNAPLAVERYIDLINIIEDPTNHVEYDTKAEIYVSLAFLLFEMTQYEYFFEMLIKAQNNGYSREKLEEILREAFIEPNLDEFTKTYNSNMEFLNSNGMVHFENKIEFQDLPYWLLPTGIENEYYLFHKEAKRIQEKISLFKYVDKQPVPTINEFADYLIVEDWNWLNILTCLNTIRQDDKKTYILVKDLPKLLSCLQGGLLDKIILSDALFFDSYQSMGNYFQNGNAYLPHNVINFADETDEPQRIINDIHNYRTKQMNRNGNQILLSVCIPSFNRGNRAYNNILHLLKTKYDEEIEIILSNNGTENETKDYYDKIGEIEDTRLNYFAFEKNQGFAVNCCKIVDMAKGSFILLVSDEDLVNFNVLDKVMSVLKRSTETLALLRTSSTNHSKQKNRITAAGEEAIMTYMLTSNYMSGIIYNNNILKQHKSTEYVLKNIDNSVCYWYPHMFWELQLCQYGAVQGTDLRLIDEGQAEVTDCDNIEIGDGTLTIPYYASIKGRLEQHRDFLEIFLELEQINPFLLRKMYINLCIKTFFLAALSIKVHYIKTDENLIDLYQSAYEYCINKENYLLKISNSLSNYEEDLAEFQKYHHHFKKDVVTLFNQQH